MIPQGLHDHLAEKRGLFLRPGNNVFLVQDLQHGESCGAPQRIAGIGMAVHECFSFPVVRIKGIVNFLRGDGDGHGHIAAREPFGDAHDVRGNAGLVAGEHAPRAAKTGGDFIRNEVHVVGVAQGTQFRQISGRIHPHACGALEQGFHQQGGAFVPMARKGLLCRVNAFRLAAAAFVPLGAAVAIRSGNAHDVQQKRFVEFRIKVQASCGEGSQGFSVVGVAQGHETYFLTVSGLVVVLETHFHGGFDGCRTVIREIEFAEPPRNFLHQFFTQSDSRPV